MQIDTKFLPPSKFQGQHRRTQSTANYDFHPPTPLPQKDDKSYKNMVETHQIFDKNQTKDLLAEEARKQCFSSEKHIVIENIEPPFQELNRYDSSEQNFFNFGKKNRNLTTIFSETSEILKEINIGDLSNRKKNGGSFHESNPAKRYERELLKEERFVVIPEQNDLLLSTEFTNNKLISKEKTKEKMMEKTCEISKEKLKEKSKEKTMEKTVEKKRENSREISLEKTREISKEKSVEKSNSESKTQHFHSLMHLKSNILNAISKTNNRYNSKEEIKTTKGLNFSKTLKENTIKNKKNSLTINLLKEKQKCATVFKENSKENYMGKHKKNSVSTWNNKKDTSFSSVKKTEKLEEKGVFRLETQMNFIKKKVDFLENQNKNFKHQLGVINEEKNLFMKVFITFSLFLIENL